MFGEFHIDEIHTAYAFEPPILQNAGNICVSTTTNDSGNDTGFALNHFVIFSIYVVGQLSEQTAKICKLSSSNYGITSNFYFEKHLMRVSILLIMRNTEWTSFPPPDLIYLWWQMLIEPRMSRWIRLSVWITLLDQGVWLMRGLWDCCNSTCKHLPKFWQTDRSHCKESPRRFWLAIMRAGFRQKGCFAATWQIAMAKFDVYNAGIYHMCGGYGWCNITIPSLGYFTAELGLHLKNPTVRSSQLVFPLPFALFYADHSGTDVDFRAASSALSFLCPANETGTKFLHWREHGNNRSWLFK